MRATTHTMLELALLAAGALAASGCAGTGGGTSVREAPIAIESVRLTAAGHYIDLRYRVIDPATAQAALGPKVRPTLINEDNGAVMAVPTTAKLGSLRQTQARQEEGRTYFVFFVNTGGVRPGSRVTAELGPLHFEDLTVQ
jgi:hypothetical protein